MVVVRIKIPNWASNNPYGIQLQSRVYVITRIHETLSSLGILSSRARTKVECEEVVINFTELDDALMFKLSYVA